MEKYAVVIDDEKTKTADTEQRCPKCGKKAFTGDNEFGDQLGIWCSNCGTEPFEKRPPEEEKK